MKWKRLSRKNYRYNCLQSIESWMKFSLLSICLLLVSCQKAPNGQQLASEYLDEKNFVPDNTINVQLDSIITGINCLSKLSTSKYFVVDVNYNAKDTNQILI